MINKLEKYVMPASVYSQFRIMTEEFAKLQKEATVDSKEAYLKWVDEWKDSAKNLEEHIRHIKFMRSAKRIAEDTEAVKFYKDYVENNNLSYVASSYRVIKEYYRDIATAMYDLRTEMKEKSKEAKKQKQVA